MVMNPPSAGFLMPVERKNHRTWYKDANPFGNKIHAVQKSRGKSTPLI